MQLTRVAVPVFTAAFLASTTAVAVGVAYAQANDSLVVKGRAVVSGPSTKSSKRTTRGEQLAFAAGEMRVQDLKFDTQTETFRGQKINLQSANVRRVFEDSVRGMSGNVDLDRAEIDRVRSRPEGQAIKAACTARVQSNTVSFSYTGSGQQPVAVPTANQLRAAKGTAQWDGTITNFRTNVKELEALNGTTVRVRTHTNVSQVDVAGAARGEVQFTLEFSAGPARKGD